jgi:hypothetical protein
MRTNEEIVARIEKLRPSDFLGFATQDLIFALDYEHAKPYLNEGVTAGEWKSEPRDRDAVVAKMLDYMPFAWDKANNCRGISASRSIAHYMSWIWLAGDDLGDLGDFEFYGKGELRKICAHYGWDADQWDDGVRTNG